MQGAYSGGGVTKPNLLAIFTLYFFSLGFAIVTPAMGKFAAAFPDQEYALINSLPTLFIGVSGLLIGPVAGRRMKFRTLAVLGSALALVGGLGPAFTDSFEIVLLCRAVTGLGLGLMIPLANALVNGNFQGERRAALLSAGSLLLNVGGIILQFLGGLLADTDWHATFYAYGLFAIALAMSFLIPEAPIPPKTSNGRIDRRLWIIVALFAVYGMLQFSVMQNTAELFEIRDVGGATVSGLALSLFTVAGCAGGASYMVLKGKAPGMVFPVLFAVTAAGVAVEAAFSDVVPMFAGLAMLGIGFGLIIPAFVDWAGRICTAATLSLGTAIVTSSMYFGNFMSMGWKAVEVAVFGEYMVANLWVFAVVAAVLAAVFLKFNPFADGKDGE